MRRTLKSLDVFNIGAETHFVLVDLCGYEEKILYGGTDGMDTVREMGIRW